MHEYSMTCTCGFEIKASAASKEEAINQMKAMMDANGIAQHWDEHHAEERAQGKPVPTVQEVHGMIEQMIQENPSPMA